MAQCGRPSMPYPLGLVVDGQFRLDARVGEGSMAHVYRAHQLGVGRDVALKMLRRELLDQPEIVARFRDESALVARLSHPHVVVVYGSGQMPRSPHPDEGAGEPYVVLELLEGQCLSRVLEESAGPLPLARALHVILALADAVGEAHARGIVHRDLKPENVMLVERGNDRDFVKLLDFGLAKVLSEPRDIRTRAGAILGTPHYVSPEGAQGLPITTAADCYSLATLLYRCLAGRLPFDAPNAITVLAQKASQAPPELRALPEATAVPAPIADFVMQNLSKKPEQRSPDARAFGQALVRAAGLAGLDVREFGLSQTLVGANAVSPPSPSAEVLRRAPHKPPSQNPEISTPAPSQADSPPSRASERGRWPVIAIVLGCFVIGALVAALWGLRQGSNTSPGERGSMEGRENAP